MWFHFTINNDEWYVKPEHIVSVMITPQVIATLPDGKEYLARRGFALVNTVDDNTHSVPLEGNEAEVRRLLGKPPLS